MRITEIETMMCMLMDTQMSLLFRVVIGRTPIFIIKEHKIEKQ